MNKEEIEYSEYSKYSKEDIDNTKWAVNCDFKQAVIILDEINRQKNATRYSTILDVLELMRLKAKCRIRGLEVDLSNGHKYFESGKQEYEELLRHLEKIDYILADIECAKKYLTKEEKIDLEILKFNLKLK